MKNKNKPTSASNGQPTHDDIAVCAYLIWEQEECPEDRDTTHWLQAETQLGATADASATV